MVKAIIFDLDGLIIDSEPLWTVAEIEVFGKYGINLTEDNCRETVGMRVDEVVEFRSVKHPNANLNLNDIKTTILPIMEKLVDDRGEAMAGVYDILNFFKSINIPMAIASGSSFSLINRVLQKLEITDFFTVIQSTENLKEGKPHPEVFLKTAEKLNVSPWECLVFEDSVFGVISAKAAKMKVVAVPEIENINNKGYCIADVNINSLEEFNSEMWDDLNNYIIEQ